MKIVRYGSLLALAGCLLLAQLLMAADGIKGNLVDVGWLERHLGDSDVLLLDASPAQVHAAQHVPGAVSADLMTYGARELPAAEMTRLFRSWGVSPGKKVVLYDQGGSMLATRIFFSLYHHGFPPRNLFILDGGLFKWQEAGLPVTAEATPAPRPGSFAVKKVRRDVKVELPEFLAASGDLEGNVLLEALGADWHFGGVFAFQRAGHIPGAILLPSADFYNEDRTFKSADELARMLTYLGIGPDRRIHTHCGGGVAASVPFFALKFLLDYPEVTLYVGSQMEWLSDERGLPYWTYDAPFLMRDARWLQSWGGQRLRMYRGSQVGILDVRPAGAFAEGHVPFSLNIPVEVFASHLARPEGLAEILGPAGLDAAHEAVVVSGAGLTKEAALAFVLLEKLGQKRVSILVDPLDEWAGLGFPLTTEATVVGPPKAPRDTSIPPTSYPRNARRGVVVAASETGRGLYPTVFIASGTDVPAGLPDGTVVHVPYTDLLSADGTPKAAMDVWNILVEAGVPRYAELVCFSEDPGEAAANYFVLKLMGYPDVKVLAM